MTQHVSNDITSVKIILNLIIMASRISRPVSTPPPSDFTKPRPQLPPGKGWEDGLILAMSDPKQILDEDGLSVTLLTHILKQCTTILVVLREDIC